MSAKGTKEQEEKKREEIKRNVREVKTAKKRKEEKTEKENQNEKEKRRKPKYGLFSCVGYIYRLLWQTEPHLVFTGILPPTLF